MEKTSSAHDYRSRKRRLLIRAFLVASLLLVLIDLAWITCNKLTLALASVQAEKLRRISLDTGLSFPPSSRVMEFSEPWFSVDPEWMAKITVPEAPYALLKDVVLKKGQLPKNFWAKVGEPYGSSPTYWWRPANIDFDRQYGQSVCGVQVIACREDGEIALYIDCVVH